MVLVTQGGYLLAGATSRLHVLLASFNRNTQLFGLFSMRAVWGDGGFVQAEVTVTVGSCGTMAITSVCLCM